MDKLFLEDCLEKGMTLDAIGELTGKHPWTIGYWLKKHGLEAVNAELHAPKGALDKERLPSSSWRAAASIGACSAGSNRWHGVDES
jgi:hypothetical protein